MIKLSEMINGINEMPKIILNLEEEFIERELLQPIKDAMKYNKIVSLNAKIDNEHDLCVIHLHKGEMIFLIVNGDNLIGATKVVKYHKNVQVHLSNKFEKNFKNMLLGFIRLFLNIFLRRTKSIGFFQITSKRYPHLDGGRKH